MGPRATSPVSSTPRQEQTQPLDSRDGKLPATLEQWLEGATEHAGSWWTDWSHWLKAHAGKQIAAPKTYGRAPSSRPSSQLRQLR